MKLADLDWNEVLAALPWWESVSPRARWAFLQIKPGTGATPAMLGTAADELVAAGLVTPPPPRGSLYAHLPGARPLLVALRTMDRMRPLDESRKLIPEAYLQDQMTVAESAALSGDTSYHAWVDRRGAVERAFSVEWVKEFLAADTPEKVRAWERARTVGGESPRLEVPRVAQALRELVQLLAAQPQGRPLHDLADLLPQLPRAHVASALAAGLRYLLLFVSLRGDEPQAVFGLLPSSARRMGPPVPAPAPVAVTETFEAAFRVADMTAVLVEAAAEPIPVRGNDLRLYVRSQKAIAPRLMSVPEWTSELLDVRIYGIGDPDDDDEVVQAAVRIALAVEALQGLKMVQVKASGARYHLAATRAGREWLARSDGERLRDVLSALRASPQRAPGWWHTREAGVDFFGTQLPFTADPSVDLRKPLAAALLSIPAGEMVPLHPFLQHQAESANPFFAPGAEKLRMRAGFSGMPRSREGWEMLWVQIVEGFLRLRLVPAGGARLGRTEGDEIAFTLTDAGRYLLGATDDFQLAAPAAGEVVVQPDFEVVFLSAAPRVEAELARFAERTGSGVGALFRLTRASILRAAELGLTADGVLKTLGQVSRTPVPANVARQVRDWFAGTRRVRFRPAVLVECPDSETAARVAGMAGGQASAVTRTLLRFDGDAKARAALAKKLRAKGIFVQE
jgi:hypothetical protein